MGGIQRNALYLDYKFQSDVLGKVETTDTLVVRNRGIKYAILLLIKIIKYYDNENE